jgi:tRNA U34 5-carboxymethylaminomethyl modifying GTPase MnmE/TrmE
MTTLLDLIDQLDLAATRAEGVASVDEIRRAAGVARTARLRRGFIGDELVIAIAGGTGSGKSSILNAVAGAEIATVSRIRPHTDLPLAWIPEASGPGLAALLDDVGIDKRVTHHATGHDPLAHVALVDLPDMDSVVGGHRRTVEDLLPRVDAILWVFDPNKYADPLVHETFLAPLSSYPEQFLFVLNQVDTVPGEDVPLLRSHLVAVLEADGFSTPEVLVTAARPDAGEPQGIEELRTFLEHEVDAKKVAKGKLVEDVRRAARDLASSALLWAPVAQGQGAERHAAERVGRLVAERVRAAPDRAAAERVLWDRARLGATVAELAVSCATVERSLREGAEA